MSLGEIILQSITIVYLVICSVYIAINIFISNRKYKKNGGKKENGKKNKKR